MSRKGTKDGVAFRWIVLSVSIALLFLIWIFRNELKDFSEYGYAGIFIVNFVSSATVFLPAPGAASVFIGGAVWNPVTVGIISGMGSAFGELFGYFVGYGGSGIFKTEKRNHKWIEYLQKNFNKSGFWTTFIFAAIPNPFFDAVGIVAGVANYPIWKFFIAIVGARILRNIMFAFTGNKIFS